MQCPTKEFGIDVFTSLMALRLDSNTNLAGRQQLSRVKERRTKHLIITENAPQGKTRSFLEAREKMAYVASLKDIFQR